MRRAVTGAILVGGDSRRMGLDKASLVFEGKPLLHHVHGILAPLCAEVLVITRPERVEAAAHTAPAGCREVSDRLEGRGPLVGIHAALAAAEQDRVLVVGCDMPWLESSLLAAMIDQGRGDVVIPRTDGGWEPLHAIYGRRCGPAIEARFAQHGPSPVASVFPSLSVDVWDAARCRKHDPAGRSFRDANTPGDLRGTKGSRSL